MAKKQNNDSDVYVKLDHSDSLDAKRYLLEMTGSAIDLQMISGKIIKLGKKEIVERNNAKKQLRMTLSEINKLLATMPKIPVEKTEKPRPVKAAKKEKVQKEENPVEKKEGKTLNDELEEVRKKIANLKE